MGALLSISIHALRVEGDNGVVGFFTVTENISIHALRVEGDLSTVSSVQVDVQFLSTPSGWRATYDNALFAFTASISIHALRVEGDFGHRVPVTIAVSISIHALRVEGDN